MGFEKISLLRNATDRRAPAWGFISPLNWTELGLKNWGEPLRWHNFFGHSFRFCKSVLASSSRRRVWGKGTHLSPRPQQPFRNLFLVLFVHKNLDRCASIFGRTFGLALEFFWGSIAQRRVQALPIVI